MSVDPIHLVAATAQLGDDFASRDGVVFDGQDLGHAAATLRVVAGLSRIVAAVRPAQSPGAAAMGSLLRRKRLPRRKQTGLETVEIRTVRHPTIHANRNPLQFRAFRVQKLLRGVP